MVVAQVENGTASNGGLNLGLGSPLVSGELLSSYEKKKIRIILIE